jgi:ABC-2 type transport system ATP-binding protein
MLVQIENLTTGYGGRDVFSDVSLGFEGGIAGLVGPNGAGKTTLLRTLLGFLPFRAGRVSVCGHELPAEVLGIRASIGYMPESEAVIGNITAVEFVTYLAELSGLPRRIAVERSHAVLQYVGLGEARYRKLDTYSTGMKQRVKLAQAIVHDPQLLLLDEPTDGLDPAGRREMLELLKDLGTNKGINIVVCSHLLDDVEFVAAEIILLNEGRIVSRKLAASAARLRPVLVRVQGDVQALVRLLGDRGVQVLGTPEGTTLRISLPSGQESQVVFAAAQEAGCTILRFEPIVEKAADILMNLMAENNHADL